MTNRPYTAPQRLQHTTLFLRKCRPTHQNTHNNVHYSLDWTLPGSVRCHYDCVPGVKEPHRTVTNRTMNFRPFLLPSGSPSLQFDPEIAHGFRRARRRRSARSLMAAKP